MENESKEIKQIEVRIFTIQYNSVNTVQEEHADRIEN